MPNEKMENLLNLALAATQEEREKSLELDIGRTDVGGHCKICRDNGGA